MALLPIYGLQMIGVRNEACCGSGLLTDVVSSPERAFGDSTVRLLWVRVTLIMEYQPDLLYTPINTRSIR